MRRLGKGWEIGRRSCGDEGDDCAGLADSEVRNGGMRGDLAHRSFTRSSMIGHWYSLGMGRDLQSVNDDEIGM
jgi:hypothetical protein